MPLGRRIPNASRRYWRDLRRYTEARLTRVEAEAPDDWPYFLGWSCAVGVALIGGLQLVEWLALGSDSRFVNALGAGFGLGLAGLGIALLAWIYWRIQLDPEDRKPYVVAMLSSLATVGVCTVAFAGLTAMLWQWGVVTTDATGAAAGLVRVEGYYAWHLVDVVPLLDVPEALHWHSPVVFSDPWSGALLLAFKILLLIPLVRVLLSGFRWGMSGWLRHVERAADKGRQRRHTLKFEQLGQESGHPPSRSLVVAARAAWMTFVLVALPLFMYGVLVLVVQRSSLLDRWLTERGFANVDWLPMTLDVLGAWLVVAIAWSLASEILDPFEHFLAGSALRALTAVVLLPWLLLLAILAAGAVTVTLLHAGIAETDAPLAASAEVDSALGWYAWHLAETVPVLDVTETLHWSTEVEFVDVWTGVLLVLMRVLLVVLLLVPFGLVFRASVRRAARARRARPQVEVTAEFVRLFDAVLAQLDDAERLVVESRSEAAPVGSIDYHAVLFRAGRMLTPLEDEVERLIALLGDGRAVEAARAAIVALEERSRTIDDADSQLFFARDDSGRVELVRQSLAESRLAALARRRAYLKRASRAMRAAVPAGVRR